MCSVSNCFKISKFVGLPKFKVFQYCSDAMFCHFGLGFAFGDIVCVHFVILNYLLIDLFF